MKIKGLPYLFLLLTIPIVLPAQDSYLSQFYTSPLSFNPASTGLINGIYRLTGNFRTQYSSVDLPITDIIASADMPYKRSGFGLVARNYTGGIFSDITFNGSYAYHFRFGKGRKNGLSFGIQAGLAQRSVDRDKITTTDPEIFDVQSVINPELNAGIMYYRPDIRARLNPFAGFSAYRLIDQKNSFTESEVEAVLKQRKYNVFGGVQINLQRKLDVIPQFLTVIQGNQADISAGILAHYFLRDDDVSVLLGGSYRVENAIVIQTGLQYRDFIFGFSYDIALSPLATAFQAGNDGLELSCVYTKKRNVKLKEDNVCPRL